jgi:hypothetical protein
MGGAIILLFFQAAPAASGTLHIPGIPRIPSIPSIGG